jgi:phosphoglycolate phosphatase-like HAD superfamily hydrolase
VISHIVWDWNGTLFDDFAVIVEATDTVLRARGFAGATVEDYRTKYRRPMRDFYSALIGRELTDAEMLEIDHEFHDSYESRMRECGLAAGALDLLRDWPVSGPSPRTQSLLSMWRHHRLVEFTAELALTDRFVRIDGLTDGAGSKKAESLRRHLAGLREVGVDLPASQVALIGDSLDDADAAAAAGAACVLHTGGIDGAATLARAGVPVVDSLAAAVDLIASW